MTRMLADAAQWPALSRLLDEALALPPEQRPAWLAALSGPDAEHRRALSELLATQAGIETGDFLQDLPALVPTAPADELTAGATVGPYRLLAPLGQGGMGVVWRAERADGTVKRAIALKLPRAVWGSAFAERLAREREILAGLEHEHIARLYDAGLDGQGRPYLAMELVGGEPIDAYCRTHGLGVAARVELLLQAMAAVAHAHSRLVVHRDLKPNNILVGADARVRLLDFGVAKLLEGELTRNTALTELAGRALTLDYASPEQIRGEPLSTGSDVYSMAVVAYEVLTGARPYRLKRGSAAELEEAIASAEVPPASSATEDRALRRQLRGDLDAILNRALKKAAADRYPSIDAFAQDLQRHLRGEPVQARPDSALYRSGRFIRRHRLGVATAAAVLVSIVAGGVISTWQWRLARAEERRATTELGRQDAIQDLYIETMSSLSVLGAEQPQELTKPGAVTSALMAKLAELGPRFATRPDERAAQLLATMLQLNYDNRFEESLAVGQEYLANLKAHGSTAQRIFTAHAALGRTLIKLGRFDQSEAMLRAGVNWPSDARDLNTESAQMSVSTDLGALLTARGKRDEALAVLTRADANVARLYAHEHLRFENLMRLALFHLGFDDARALTFMQQSRAELLANGTTGSEWQAQTALNLGRVLLANGQSADAEAALTEAMSIIRREYGRGSRNAVNAFGAWASAVSRRDPARAASAIEAERRALQSGTAGLSAFAGLQLRARQIEAHWVAGDTTASDTVAWPGDGQLLAPAELRDNEFVLLQRVRALVQSGRAAEGLPLIQKLQSNWPDRNLPTLSWLRIQEALAEAQLAAGLPEAAGKTADAMIRLLEKEHATAGRAYRCAASLGAWAAVRRGDRDEAARLLDRLPQAVPPFPSAAERADCELRRAEALIGLSRDREGADVAREALRELDGQHPASPRLALAQRLVALEPSR